MPVAALPTRPIQKATAPSVPTPRVPRSSARQAEPRLDSLTSLRFFAASMILLLHTSQLFGFNSHTCLDGLALWQGVSFFFVLSGFILAYVYPEIKTATQSNHFLLARFARIWPTHFAAFLFTIALIPTVLHIPNLIPTAVANLCMVQVWTFSPAMSESFNSVSWTISIELFFYLCFPFLIQDFNKPLKLRWAGAAVVALSFIGLCMMPGALGMSQNALPTSLYLGENPVCRLFEFTLGIAVCWLFRQKSALKKLSKTQATFLEITSIAVICAAVSLSNWWPAQNAVGALSIFRAWAIDMGGAPAYGALILLIATERGAVAQFLNKKIFVKLGEISFSMYMFHLSILYALLKYQSSFSNLPGWILPTTGVVACLVVSHLNFTLIETPVRRWIMQMVRPSNKNAQNTLWLDELTFTPPYPEAFQKPQLALSAGLEKTANWLEEVVFAPPYPRESYGIGSLKPSASVTRVKAMSAGNNRITQTWVVAELAVLVCIVFWINVQFRFIPVSLAQRIESHSIPTTRNIDFGGRFKLHGLKLSKKPEGLYIDAVWESLGKQRLENLNAVEVIDPESKTMSTQTYPQDQFERSVTAGKIWEDKIYIPADKLKGALRVGLSVHTAPLGKSLTANCGVRDGDNGRLLVAIP